MPIYIFSLSDWSDTAKPFHEVCGARSLLHRLPGSACPQCLRSLCGCQESAQRNHHRPPASGVQGQNHTVLVDRDVNHEVGVGWVHTLTTLCSEFDTVQSQPIKIQKDVSQTLSKHTLHCYERQSSKKIVAFLVNYEFWIFTLIVLALKKMLSLFSDLSSKEQAEDVSWLFSPLAPQSGSLDLMPVLLSCASI